MQAIPAIDDHGKEGAYRSKMAALCPRLAAGEKSTHDALTNAAAWQQAAAGSVPELPSDLQQNAKRISGCLLYHVCLYAALTLYRNPPDGLQPASCQGTGAKAGGRPRHHGDCPPRGAKEVAAGGRRCDREGDVVAGAAVQPQTPT